LDAQSRAAIVMVDRMVDDLAILMVDDRRFFLSCDQTRDRRGGPSLLVIVIVGGPINEETQRASRKKYLSN
jgi:hypothetical protein